MWQEDGVAVLGGMGLDLARVQGCVLLPHTSTQPPKSKTLFTTDPVQTPSPQRFLLL